ncbi:MAG TPA: MFS transporter [Actinomycetota bacterium]
MSQRAGGGMFRAALSHRDYRFLLSGLAISETGNWLYAAASIIYIFEATGSTSWIGVAAVVRLLPYILFGPIGGAIADRFDRRMVMIVSDLARAALMGVLTVVALSDSTTAVVTVIVITFVNNSFSAPYYPAVTAITPSVVTEDDLAAANALSGTIDNFALAFGPALSAVLLLLGDPPVAFAANGLTFVVSAFLVTRMGVRGKVGEVEVESTLRSRMVAGARAIRTSREAMLLVGLSVAFGFTFGQEIVLFGPITEDFLGMSLDATGLLFAAPGIGGILATAAAGKLASRSHTARILAISVMIAGVPLTMLSVVHAPIVAYLLLTVEGAAVIIADVVSTTTLQRVVPEERIGSVFGILGATTVAGTALGSLVAPVSIDVFGLGIATALAGGVLLALTVGTLPMARRLDARAAARASELAPRVQLLEQLGIFEGATTAQLEALAASATEEQVSPGAVLIRQGEQPDDLFAVVDGEVHVSVAEDGSTRVVAQLGSGDYFGEIGLLEKRPRTATVTAIGETRLFRIPGKDFLRIVNEGPRLSTTLLAAISNRLAATSSIEELGHA